MPENKRVSRLRLGSRSGPQILGSQFGIEQREPFSGERDFFDANRNIAGMATSDDRVILNPFFGGSPEESQSVLLNERGRVFMRTRNLRPTFSLSKGQQKFFGNIEGPKETALQDQRETIAARILAGDPSAGDSTPEQIQFSERLREAMQQFDRNRFRLKGKTQ